MEEWLKWILGIIGGGSAMLGIVVLILFLIGSPEDAQNVREVPGEVNAQIDSAAKEVAKESENVISQLNYDRKKAVSNVDDPYQKSIINWTYLYVMIAIILVFWGLVKGILKTKI